MLKNMKKTLIFLTMLGLSVGLSWASTEGEGPNKGGRMSRVKAAIEIGALGAGRAVLGLPLEHPFDTIKTRWQAHPGVPSVFNVASDIISKKGYSGFYSGFVPNTVRAASKQVYRYPMMILFPPMYEAMIPDDANHNRKYLRKIATGLTIANAEVFVISPLERLKVWLMTKENKGNLTEFFNKSSGHVGRELYKGFSATLPKQNVSWVSFLWADEWCKTQVRHYVGREELSHSELMVSGGIVGVINTAATLPFDNIKTRMQMAQTENMNFFDVAKDVVSKNGVKGFYAGWQPRIVQYMIQAMLTVNLLDYLENKFSKKES
jgi:hypothetical protein